MANQNMHKLISTSVVYTNSNNSSQYWSEILHRFHTCLPGFFPFLYDNITAQQGAQVYYFY